MYEVILNNTTGTWTFNYNGAALGSTQHNYWQGKTLPLADYVAEVHSRQTQMVGTAALRCNWNACMWRPPAGAWTNAAPTGFTTDAAQWGNAVNGTQVQAWDVVP